MRARRMGALLGILCLTGSVAWPQQADPSGAEPPWQAFIAAASSDRRVAQAALDEIAGRWRHGYTPMLIDVARFLPAARTAQSLPESDAPGLDDSADGQATAALPGRDGATTARQLLAADARRRIVTFLGRQTTQRFGDDLRAWRRWMWNLPADPHADYAAFKAELYGRIDPAFRDFFPPGVDARIRLDEIDWGGVPVNGIPPLRAPTTIAAGDATWLRDGHIVFGIVVNGEARAYPKRILAWHEMATDTLGGIDLTIVYCTLCGTVIPYESRTGDRTFTFGTSGLLYRSNKLMFDEETRSLWSSMEGTPVVGPLAGTGLRLTFRSVVTTTWGDWRREHPTTTVLSLDTGHDRDYAEGAAYREYFRGDDLMFEVPTRDRRLKSKAEVLVLRPEVVGAGSPPVAIAVDRLAREPVYTLDVGARAFVVVTSKGGANRVYERGSHAFVTREADGTVRDGAGRRWRVTPDALVLESGERLPRVAAHRAFWFGWVAQHPATVLHQ